MPPMAHMTSTRRLTRSAANAGRRSFCPSQKLNREVNAALVDHKMKARFAEFGATTLGGSSSDFGKLIADETEKWAEVVRSLGMKPE
jgi:hypothetical protein